MARIKKITVGALNITMHPHKPELYASLFEHLHAAATMMKIRGADWGMIGTCQTTPQDTSILYGSIWRFLNLDPDEPWLDLSTRKEVGPDDGPPIIPDHLKPHLRTAEYVFMTNGHRLFFDTRKISPSMLQKLIAGLCSAERVKKHYGDIAVTVECEQEGMDQIMELDRRASLDIFIHRPNGDDLSHKKDKILKRLGVQNASTINEVLKAQRGESLDPDEETQAMMELALSNGRLKAVGYTEDDERVEISSEQHPLKRQVEYDPENETFFNILIDTGIRLLEYLRKRG